MLLNQSPHWLHALVRLVNNLELIAPELNNCQDAKIMFCQLFQRPKLQHAEFFHFAQLQEPELIASPHPTHLKHPQLSSKLIKLTVVSSHLETRRTSLEVPVSTFQTSQNALV